ncbi:MAG: hypothetical protein JWR48_7085 [Mycobacterium sp.]|jgi:hypothetical protein|nr:hypothetical protein [Mycobacterium sp.]
MAETMTRPPRAWSVRRYPRAATELQILQPNACQSSPAILSIFAASRQKGRGTALGATAALAVHACAPAPEPLRTRRGLVAGVALGGDCGCCDGSEVADSAAGSRIGGAWPESPPSATARKWRRGQAHPAITRDT